MRKNIYIRKEDEQKFERIIGEFGGSVGQIVMKALKVYSEREARDIEELDTGELLMQLQFRMDEVRAMIDDLEVREYESRDVNETIDIRELVE